MEVVFVELKTIMFLYKYTLKVKSNEIVSVLAEDKKTEHFIFPVTQKGKKIYLVGKNGFIHYVGMTKQPIGFRIRRNRYYKWLKENGDHYLVICLFKNDINIEAIEAEIVYFFRQKYNRWPKYQTEIHFHSTSKSERTLAKRILKESQNIMRDFG